MTLRVLGPRPRRLPVAGIALLAGCAAAQDYPVKPVRLVIPFAPGGTTDVVGRVVGAKLAEVLGQQLVYDNRGGAGGTIGVELVTRAAPDGYTLLFANSGTLAVNPTLYPKLPYDTRRDLAPVTLIAKVPNLLVVHPSLPTRSVSELIALARAKPGQLTFGTGGVGSGAHLAAEYFRLNAGIALTHVPYKGVGPALIDLLGGQISLSFAGVPASAPHARSGRLRALGVSGLKRIAILPEVPTIAEAAVPGFESVLWYGLATPTGTSAPIVARLHQASVRALQDRDLRARLDAEGSESVGSTPEEFGRFIVAEIARWAPVIRASGAKPD